MAGVNYTRQYETPIRPENWTGDAGRFYRMLIDVLDDIYLKYGRIDEKMLGSALAQKINSKADNGDVAEIRLEQGRLTASFTSLSGAVTQLTLDVDGLGLAISDSEQRLQTQIDAVPGQITAAVEDAEEGLQAQIDLVPGQITAEVSGQLANYTPTGIVDGSQLIINRDEFHVDTPKYSVNVSGTNGDMTLDENGLAADVITSPSVRPMYTGPEVMSVEGGEIDGINTFNALSDCLAKLDGKYLPYAVTIKIFSAQTEGTIEFGRTDGEAITVVSGFAAIKPQINAQLSLRGVRNQIVFDGITFAYAYADAIFINDCHMVVFNNCEIATSHTASGAGMYANTVWAYRSSVELHSCGVFGGYSGLAIEGNTRAFVEACYGSGNEYGIFARGNASVGVKTSMPAGNTANTYVETDSVVRGATTVSTGTSPTVPPETTTVQIDCTNSRTYAGGWYNNSATMVAQGVVNGTSFRGYMWFDFSSVRGKTIQRAAIRLYRKSGIGKNRDVDVYIGAMNCAGPNNSVSSRMDYGKITVAGPKEQIKVTIPTEALQAIANGSYNGLYVYSPSADDYAAFDGFGEAHPPKLLVTY